MWTAKPDLEESSVRQRLESPEDASRSPVGGRLDKLLTMAASGLLIGLMEIVLVVSFATLIFANDLANFVPRAIGLMLLGAFFLNTIIALFSSMPGVVGGAQESAAAVLAAIAMVISDSMPVGAALDDTFVTIMAAIITASLATGIFFFALGSFRLGDLIRFLPYPVIGGFLAATGWLLTTGGLDMMIGRPTSLAQIPLLFQPDLLLRWLPGLIMALLIFTLMNRTGSSFVLLGILLVGTAIFFGVAWLSDVAVAELSRDGWLLGPFPEGNLWRPLRLADASRVHWPTLLQQGANIGSVVIVSTMALLLNASGLERATNRDISYDRELQTAGAANVVNGFFGGIVGFQQLGLSVFNHKVGVRNRITGLVATSFTLLTLFLGASIVALIPKMILGSVILLLGLTFLHEWVLVARKKLPKIDYLIILMMVLVTGLWGFLEAVGVGLLAAVAMFVISYSRGNVVWSEQTGDFFRSRVTRDSHSSTILEQHGASLHILRLQGFMFFGTAENLLTKVRDRVLDSSHTPPRAIVLDFRRVSGIDSTAVFSFTKMRQLAQETGFTLVLTDLSPDVEYRLTRAGFEPDEIIRSFADLDRGLEWCETELLQVAPDAIPQKGILQRELAHASGDPHVAAQLLSRLEKVRFQAGDCLMRQGDAPDVLYFIESGQVTAQLTNGDAEPVRLQTMGGGHVVGEIGFFLDNARTADVLADEATTAYRLDRELLAQIQADDPATAASLQELFIHLLAERVSHLVTAVDALRT